MGISDCFVLREGDDSKGCILMSKYPSSH